MENWFDALSRPHTRRTALKAAAAAVGTALALPAMRPQAAWAIENEPCFDDCISQATAKWDASWENCKLGEKLRGWSAFGSLGTGGLGQYALLEMLNHSRTASCLASGELTWGRDANDCRGSECGNSTKYPGGAVPKPLKPKPKCDPVQEKACGDRCCYVTTDCCLKNGEYVCYAVGHNCGNS